MLRYVLTKKAVQDLSEIWDYTFYTWSEKQADKYYKSLLDACNDLANEKMVGKQYREVAETVFGCRIGEHIIFYRKISGSIEVARILHTKMDINSKQI
jgi:toxin ParE1/3/4